MAMIKLGLGFFTSYWREIAIGLIIAITAFITISWWHQGAEINRLKTQLTMAEQVNDTLKEKVSSFEKAEEQAKVTIANADKNRQEIIKTFQVEINKIRTQAIPKDCNGAVNYGIQFKDDLQWPKRSQ